MDTSPTHFQADKIFRLTKVEVVQHVATEHLQHLLQWLVKEVGALQEAQKSIELKYIIDKLSSIEAESAKTMTEVATLKGVQVLPSSLGAMNNLQSFDEIEQTPGIP